MPDREAFFAAIRERPNDDAPRLVYADWLDEQGDSAHAELIRVQCEIDRLAADTPQLAELKTREQELLAQKFGDCFEPKLNKAECPDIQIKRGFISELCCSYRYYLANEELWVRSAPNLRMSFTGSVASQGGKSNPKLAKISERTSLRNWVFLSWFGFDGEHIGEGFRKLVGSPYLTNLLQLQIQGFELGAVGIRALASSAVAQRLQIMRLSFGVLTEEEMRAGVGDEALRIMLAKRQLPNLQKLGLFGIITDRGAEELFNSPSIAGIDELYLGGEQLGPSVISGLTRSPYLTHLKCLRLRDVQLTKDETRLLADWLAKVPLIELNLANAEMDAEAIRSLCNWPHRATLKELYLDGMSDGTIAELAASPCLLGLEHLGVSWDMRDVRLWSNSPPPPRRSNASVIALASSPHLSNLRHLGLGPDDTSNAPAWALIDSPFLQNLQESPFDFSDEAAWAVIDSPFLQNLQESPFWSARAFSGRTVQALRERFGKESVTAE
jgi:uncharacterized protein (TIGR02996 family)